MEGLICSRLIGTGWPFRERKFQSSEKYLRQVLKAITTVYWASGLNWPPKHRAATTKLEPQCLMRSRKRWMLSQSGVNIKKQGQETPNIQQLVLSVPLNCARQGQFSPSRQFINSQTGSLSWSLISDALRATGFPIKCKRSRGTHS